MKKLHLYLLSLLTLVSSAQAFQPKVEIVEQFDNLRMVAFVAEQAIDGSPVWDPQSQPLPLQVDGAIRAVRDFNKSSTATKVEEIEIRPVPGHETHWHYLVKVANPDKVTKHDIYVVLMDGQVIPAMIEPQGYK